MKALPNKFTFRVSHLHGYTHGAAKNANGDYEIKWARGYPNKIRSVPRMTFSEDDAQRMVEGGGWVVVEDKPKQPTVPDVFQFQLTDCDDKEVFTATRVSDDSYKVTWESDGNGKKGMGYTDKMVKGILAEGGWKIVEQPEFPDEFFFQTISLSHKYKYHMIRNGDVWKCWRDRYVGEPGSGAEYSAKAIRNNIERNAWEICEGPKPLTAEQQRALKEYKEQVAALDSIIRLNEQTIHHHEILIGNYKNRQQEIQKKIAELEGMV